MGGAGSFIRRGLWVILVLGLATAGCAGGGTAQKKDNPDIMARLQKVDVTDAADYTAVVAEFDKPVIFNSVHLSAPPKLVVDLAGVDLGDNITRIDVNKGPVSSIMPSKVANTKRLARLEIGLEPDADYKIVQDGGVLKILFDKKMKPAAEEAKTAEETRDAATADAKVEDKKPVADADASNKVASEVPALPKTDVAKAAPEKAEPAAGTDAVQAASQPKPVITVDKGAVGNGQAAKSMQAQAAKPADTTKPELPEATRVENITCSKSEGAYQVTIAGNGRFSNPNVFMLGKDRLVVDLPGAGSLKEKENLDVGGDCLKKVRMARHQGAENKVRVVLDIAGSVDYDVKGNGKSLVLTVAKAGSKVPAKPVVKTETVTVHNTDASKSTPVMTAKADTSAKPSAKQASLVTPGGDAKAHEQDNVQSVDLRQNAKSAEGVKIYVSKSEGKTVLSSAPVADTAGLTKTDEKTGDFVETPTKIYTGGKISFDVQDADLDKVIKLLADVAGLNLIMDSNEVKGKVTLKLDNVPWDQALDILLKIYNLDKVLEGNVLRVAPKAKLDDEKKRELMLITEQKKLQEDAQDLFTKTFKLNNATATDLEAKVKKILSKRGDATSNPRTNELIVTDVKDGIDKAEKLIRILDKGVHQIVIEARIVEVEVNYSQSLGISWGLQHQDKGHRQSIGTGNHTLSFSNTVAAPPAPGDPSALDTTQQNGSTLGGLLLSVPSALNSASDGGGLGGLAGSFLWAGIAKQLNVDLTIEALESIGKAETLSAPKVMTLENQAASIVNGSTLYVQTTTASGTAPMPLNANLSLTVTPRVTGDNFIVLDVVATDNTPNLNPPAGATAAINTKSVTTKVMVKDGNTIVLGGIYTKSNSLNDNEIPYLGRLPLVGWLFRQRTVAKPTTELLIFITPKMVKQPGEV